MAAPEGEVGVLLGVVLLLLDAAAPCAAVELLLDMAARSWDIVAGEVEQGHALLSLAVSRADQT